MTKPLSLGKKHTFDAMLARGLLALAIIGALFFLATDVNYNIAGIAVLVILLVALGWTVLLIRTLISMITRRSKPHWGVCVAVPLIAMACLLLGSANVPLRCAVWVSRSSLDSLAARTIAAPPGTQIAPCQAGLFAASEIHTFPGGMAFRTHLVTPEFWCGLAYVPSGKPPTVEGYHFIIPVGGNWFEIVITSAPYPNNEESGDLPVDPPTTRP